MKLSFTSDAKDRLLELTESSKTAARQAIALVARLDYIEKHGVDEFLRDTNLVNIADIDGTEFFHISEGNLNMIFVRHAHRPEDLVLTKFYINGKLADREKAVA